MFRLLFQSEVGCTASAIIHNLVSIVRPQGADRQAPALLAACSSKLPPSGQPISVGSLLACVQASLKRFQLDYVDLLFCHRPDVATPIEETVRAMNWCIDQVGAVGSVHKRAGIAGPLVFSCASSEHSFCQDAHLVLGPGA